MNLIYIFAIEIKLDTEKNRIHNNPNPNLKNDFLKKFLFFILSKSTET
jgi:hypothetical protein